MAGIVITRHGEYNRLPGQNDGHLSVYGRQRIRYLAKIFKKYFQELLRNGLIFCSPSIRGRETADIFQRRLEGFGWHQIIEDARIAEKINLKDHFRMVAEHPDLSTGEVYALLPQPPGSETYEETAKRFDDFMREIVDRFVHRTVIVVTHAPVPDYLLLQHFPGQGLCWGKDLEHGEFLTIRRSQYLDDEFILGFRGRMVITNKQGLLFDPGAIQKERKRRGYR